MPRFSLSMLRHQQPIEATIHSAKPGHGQSGVRDRWEDPSYNQQGRHRRHCASKTAAEAWKRARPGHQRAACKIVGLLARPATAFPGPGSTFSHPPWRTNWLHPHERIFDRHVPGSRAARTRAARSVHWRHCASLAQPSDERLRPGMFRRRVRIRRRQTTSPCAHRERRSQRHLRRRPPAPR